MTKTDAPPAPLTSAQEEAATLIGTGKSVSAAAREIGVHRQTVSGWLNRNHRGFRDLVAKVQGEHQAQLQATSSLDAASTRDAIAYLRPKVIQRLEEALDAESYIVDGEGKVHTFANQHVRLKAMRLWAQMHGDLVTRVEHSGEVGVALRGVPDDELDRSLVQLLGPVPGLEISSSN